MPADLDDVKRIFFGWGRDHGFARRSRELSRPAGETMVMLELQGSDHTHSYYINVGFVITELHDTPVTRYGQADLDFRAEHLDSSQDLTVLNKSQKELRSLLDMENDLDEETREAGLVQRLDDLLPLIEAASTVVGLRKLYADGFLTHGLLTKEARELLASSD